MNKLIHVCVCVWVWNYPKKGWAFTRMVGCLAACHTNHSLVRYAVGGDGFFKIVAFYDEPKNLNPFELWWCLAKNSRFNFTCHLQKDDKFPPTPPIQCLILLLLQIQLFLYYPNSMLIEWRISLQITFKSTQWRTSTRVVVPTWEWSIYQFWNCHPHTYSGEVQSVLGQQGRSRFLFVV